MKLTILSAKGKVTETIEIADEATVAQLKLAYKPKVDRHSKAFKLQPAKEGERGVSIDDDKKQLKAYGLKDGSVIEYKNLGPQIGYRTVFVVEYAGPIALMALYAMRPSFIYGVPTTKTELGSTQSLYIMMFLAHFVKRELETFFVHKFSRPTMPLSNIFKNSMYYWSFAAFIGYFLCHPQYTAPTHGLEIPAAIAWAVMELGNFLVHYKLSTMRKEDGDTSRNVPKGPLFSLVSCPNYSFEIFGWVFYSLGCNIAMSWVFTLVGFLQMSEWALKKHKGYVKTDAANKKKKALIPFLL